MFSYLSVECIFTQAILLQCNRYRKILVQTMWRFAFFSLPLTFAHSIHIVLSVHSLNGFIHSAINHRGFPRRLLKQIDDERSSHISPPTSLLILNTLEQRHGVNTNKESHHEEDLIGFHSSLRIHSVRLPNWTSPQIKEHKCVAPACFLTPPISVIVTSVQTFILLHINFKKGVSRMYNVTISYLHLVAKRQEKGTYFGKGLWLYYLPIFFPSPHFFLLLSTKYPVFCLLSMSVVCYMTCFTDSKLLSRLRVGCSEGDHTWKVWGLPWLILQDSLLSLFK